MSKRWDMIGLDLSLNGAAICLARGDATRKMNEEGGPDVEHASFTLGEDYRGIDRVHRIMEAFESWYWARVTVGHTAPRVAVIEGYGFSSQHAHSLGEIGGCVKRWLWQQRIPFIIVPPTTLKKFISGAGNSEKNVMMKKIYQRWGFDVDDDNRCDAYSCAMVGLRSLAPADTLTAYEVEFFTKKVERWDRDAPENIVSGRGKARAVAGPARQRRTRRVADGSAV